MKQQLPLAIQLRDTATFENFVPGINAEAHDWLLARAGNARMTGTGACVFAWFPHEEAAQDVFLALPEEWQGFVARGLNRSPLLERFEGLIN